MPATRPKDTKNPLPADAPGTRAPRLTERIRKADIAARVYGTNEKLVAFPLTEGGGWGWNESYGFGWVDSMLIEQMLMHPKVAQAFRLWKSAVIGQGGRDIPAVPPSHPQYEQAWKYADFLNWNRRFMRGSWVIQMGQLLDCAVRGNKIAPVHLRVQEWGQYKDKWVLDELPVWRNGTYIFQHDDYGRFAGVEVPERDGNKVSYSRRNFFILSYEPQNDNPYGTNILAALCESYWRDRQVGPEEIAYMNQYGRPSLYVIAPKIEPGEEIGMIKVYDADGNPVIDADTNEQIEMTPTEYNAAVGGENYKAGTWLALAPGSTVGLLQAAAGGESLFRYLNERTEAEIAGVFLGTSQITEAKRVQSSGNASTSEETMSMGAKFGKWILEEEIENTISRIALEVNYGQSALDLLPIHDLGSGMNPRIVSMTNAYQGLFNAGGIGLDQHFYYCIAAGLPVPTPADVAQIKERMKQTATRGSGGNPGNTKPEPSPAPSEE